jgi:glutaredoxin
MKIVLLMLTALQLWAGDVYPTLFAKMGDPLFSYAAKTGALKSDAKLGGSVSAYVRQAQSVREDGLRVQQSGTAQERNAYLGELRSLQKTHDRLMVDVKREVLSAQKAGDTKRVMRIVSTEPAVMRDDFRLRDTLVAFYTQKRLEGKSAFMDVLVRDSSSEIRYARENSTVLREHPTVTVLGTPTCPYCKKTRNFLRAKGIPFRDYNIKTSSTGKQLYKQHNGQGVPMVIVGEKVIRGHNPKAILRAYGK